MSSKPDTGFPSLYKSLQQQYLEASVHWKGNSTWGCAIKAQSQTETNSALGCSTAKQTSFVDLVLRYNDWNTCKKHMRKINNSICTEDWTVCSRYSMQSQGDVNSEFRKKYLIAAHSVLWRSKRFCGNTDICLKGTNQCCTSHLQPTLSYVVTARLAAFK